MTTMNKRALRLAVTILLGLSSLGYAAPMQEASAPIESGVSAPAGAMSAIAGLESGNVTTLAAMSVNTDATVAFIRAAAADPALLNDAAVRAEAERALGHEGVARLQAAAASLAAQSDPKIKAVLASWRRQEGVKASRAKRALDAALRATASWTKSSETTAAAGARTSRRVSPLSKSSRLRSAVAGAAMAAGALAAVPAYSQSALLQPAVMTSQQTQAHLIRVADEQPTKMAAKDVQDMLDNFQPSAQVILLGRPRISAREIDRILAAIKGKPYVVVIAAHPESDGNVYTIDKNTYEGVDAIEWAVNEGVYKRSSVLEKTDPATGKQLGAIFTIVFKDKGGTMFFRASDEMRAYGVGVLPKDAKAGDHVFKGELDRPALNKLRNGLDVVGAVTETFSTVESLLNQRVTAEMSGSQSAVASAKSAVDALADKQAAFRSQHAAAFAGGIGAADVASMRRAVEQGQSLVDARKAKEAAAAVSGVAARAQQASNAISSFETAFAAATGQIADARAAVDSLDKAAAAFRSQHKDAAGDLARPNTAAMRDALKSAEAMVNTKPDQALAQIRQVKTQAGNASDALAQFPNGEKRLQAAQQQLKQLRGDAYAGSVRSDLDTADKMINDAARQLREGSSGWNLKLEAAEGKLLQAKKNEGSARDSAATRRMLEIFGALLALLGLGAFGFIRRRKIAPLSAKIEEDLKPWDAKFAAMDDAALDNVDKWLLANTSVGWQGKTAELVGQVKEEAGTADLYRKSMRGIYSRMVSLARPSLFSANGVKNIFSAANYEEVEHLLQDEEVPVEIEQRRQDWRADLYGSIDNFKPKKMKFSAMVDSHNEHARKAVELMDQVQDARSAAATLVNDVQGAVAAVTGAQASLKNADGRFQAAALFDKALPQAKQMLDKAAATKDNDPVGALAAGGGEAKRIAVEGKALAEALVAARSGALAQADEAARQLAAASLKNAWIDAEKARLSAEADAMASDVVSGSIAGRTQALTQALSAIAANAGDAIKGLQALQQQNARAVALKNAVGEARAKIGQLTGLAADKVLVEKDANPDDQVSDGVKAGQGVEKALNDGNLAGAKKAFEAMQTSLDNAQSMINVALKTAEGYQQTFAQRAAETKSLSDLVAPRQAVLDSMRKDFAKSVLSLGNGDATHPGANGTIDDNIEEAQAALDAAAAKTQRSQAAFKAGKLLEAADLLTQAQAHNEVAQSRLDEISEKRARLDKQASANDAAFKALKDRGTALEALFKDNRTMKLVEDKKGNRTVPQGTMLDMENAESRFDEIAKLMDAKKGDPFKTADAIAEVNGMLDRVDLSYKNDIDAFESFRHAADAAANQLNQSLAQLDRARGNGASPLTRGAANQLNELKEAAQAVSVAAADAHLDWPAWEREANRILTEAAHQQAILKDELAHANQATQAINDAAAQVAAATNWNGGFGVYIPGSPGIEQLNAARQALANGDYAGAQSYATAAAQAAAQALADAQAEAARRQRAQQQAEADRQAQIDAERQARQQAEEQRRSRTSDDGVSWNTGGSSSGADRSDWGASNDKPSSGADRSDF